MRTSSYTTTFNLMSGSFPFEECIKGAASLVDEVVVLDGGSTDGTFERLSALSRSLGNVVLRQSPYDKMFPTMDGLQKQRAREICTGDILLQLDADEVLHELQTQMWRDAMQYLYTSPYLLLSTPVFNCAFAPDHYNVGGHTWKWRLSKNVPNVRHGVNAHSRQVIGGVLYSLYSDGCEYVDQNNMPVPHATYWTKHHDYALQHDRELYKKICDSDFQNLPTIWHCSYLDMEAKYRNWQLFWKDQWKSIRPPGSDSAENDYWKGGIEGVIRSTPAAKTDTRPPQAVLDWYSKRKG